MLSIFFLKQNKPLGAMPSQKQPPNNLQTRSLPQNPKQCVKDKVQCKVKNSGDDHLEQGLARLDGTNLLIALGAMRLYGATSLETNLAQPTNKSWLGLIMPYLETNLAHPKMLPRTLFTWLNNNVIMLIHVPPNEDHPKSGPIGQSPVLLLQ